MKVGNITRRVAGESGESCPGRDTGGLGVQVSGAGHRAAFLGGPCPAVAGGGRRRGGRAGETRTAAAA